MLAKLSGELALAQSLALRCAKDLAAVLDWAGAQEVLSAQESLLVRKKSITQIVDCDMLSYTGLLKGQFTPKSEMQIVPYRWDFIRPFRLFLSELWSLTSVSVQKSSPGY